MLRSYAKEFNTRLTGYEWIDFLGWLFKNWSQMMATSLGWMTKCPECPTPGLVAGAKLRAHLESAWRKREELAMQEAELHEDMMWLAAKKKRNEPKVGVSMTEDEKAAFIGGLHRSRARRRKREHLESHGEGSGEGAVSIEEDRVVEVPESYSAWEE